MEAYRDRYAEIQKQHGCVLAISIDDVETMKKFRDSLKAPQTFIADPDKALIKLFDTKMAVLPVASRRTFVIGKGRKVLYVEDGMEAIDGSKSVKACGLHAHDDPKALDVMLKPDAGR